MGKARAKIGHKEAFYGALDRALHNYLKAKLRIETSDFSKDKIKALLGDKSASESSIVAFLDVLESCELARYTPVESADMKQDYAAAAEAISNLDKQLK